MGLNVAGIVGIARVCVNPTLFVPNLVVKDIRQLDWKLLQSKGVNALIFDKDNCITKPLHDNIHPELKSSWKSILTTFGRKNVLIVSNSAGTRSDPCLLQAESVSRNLNVPVLVHAAKKPSCLKPIQEYFSPASNTLSSQPKQLYVDSSISATAAKTSISSLATPSHNKKETQTNESNPPSLLSPPIIAIIGDRFSTDVVLANRLARETGWKVCSIITTKLPEENEEIGIKFMRRMEWMTYRMIMRWREKTNNNKDALATTEWSNCVIPDTVAYPPLPPTRTQIVLRTGRRWTRIAIVWILKRIYRSLRRVFAFARKQITLKYQQRKASKVVT